LAIIRQQILAARNGGRWDGAGIGSSLLTGFGSARQVGYREARYDPVTGNISMQAVDDNGDPTSLAINGFQFLSETNMLSGDTALFPPAPVGSGIYFKTSNRDFGVFGLDSEIYAIDSNQVAIFDGTWDLGDVAATNMTQADLLTNFTTDADSTPGGSAVAGGYLYWVVGDAGYTLGSIIAVPEPATLGLAVLAVCGLLCCRQFTAARTSVFGKSSPLKSNASSKATAAA
jgi:hypothetical protein